jgi:UDP-glucose 4-epimerase
MTPLTPYEAVIPKFAMLLRSGVRSQIFGDGSRSRDFTCVDNAVHANILAAAAPDATRGQVINIACGTRFSLLDLLRRMSEILGVSCDPEFLPARIGDIRDSEADISAAEALIGYVVQVPFEVGLRRTLQVP